MTYGDWSAAWWQYVLAFPNSTNPYSDLTGVSCSLGQSASPVFFLVGAPQPVTRTCTVPAGKALFFPIVNAECSTVEAPPFNGTNGQELRTCVALFENAVITDSLHVTIDHRKIHDLDTFRVQSPLFGFATPANDNFLGVPGATSGSSVSDGYWVMLKPLSPGHHMLHFEAAYSPSFPFCPGCTQNVTYNLIVTQ
jgi:hypothetical protein